LAAYVIPVDAWYILPEKLVRGMWSVGLHPELHKSKYGDYEEVWDLLGRRPRQVIPRIEACAEECVGELTQTW
jgi:hypothetical protein